MVAPLSVNRQRLRQDIEDLACIGRGEKQGIYRMAFSAADMQARAWLKQRIEEAGLDYHLDGAANIHGRLGWNEHQASVMTGSHIDTVPGGGHLDGALGVMAGLECLRCLRELALPLKHPVELVAFSDEEGRFGGIFGSSALCGHLTPESIHNARDLDGITLTEAMAVHGLDAMNALNAARSSDSIKAFIELHIEQGPVLDHYKKAIGIVDAIAGLLKWNITLTGIAGHAGATPMELRQDAFHGLAEFSCQIPRILAEHGQGKSVATIGRVEVFPGAANVVPGCVKFSLDVRDTDAQILDQLAEAFRRTLSTIAQRRQLMFEYEVLSRITPRACDPKLISLIEASCSDLGIDSIPISSGAAHDTQIMSTIAPSAMIFVPSKDGRSHSAAEWTTWEDIETGANVLLNTLYQLASQS